MSGWYYLLGAIALEVAGTFLLKLSNGFEKWHWGTLSILCYSACFWVLAPALKVIPVGVAYAIWSGVGIVLISLIAWLFLGQKLDAPAVLGMGLIVAGVVVLNVFSKTAAH